MFCCTLLYVHSSIAIILMGKRELVAFLNFSSWCLEMVEWLFLAVPWCCLRFVIVVFPDHTDLLFFYYLWYQPHAYFRCGVGGSIVIDWLLILLMFVGVRVWSMLCNAVISVLSCFAIISLEDIGLVHVVVLL